MNKATRINTATLGTIFGISGICHGFFEILQGNAPTGGFYISAIGEAQRMWPHGNEYAFTVIHNYLMTGSAAILIGLGIITWSINFVHKKNGPTVFLLLFVMLFMAGGGVAQILFFPLFWIVSTRINKPLAWWRKMFPFRIHALLCKSWPWFLISGSSLLLFVLVVAVTGFVPAVKDPNTVLSIMLSCLIAVVFFITLTLVSGFSHDITMRSDTARIKNQCNSESNNKP